ncbi:hypothetical protein UFOVP435_45 [uncultured Caudovirales phage]|uniref:Uncharacterized protein n=1 Tax=uncultured Caudovirales phage TaxID=2100421 RepID=A0A6J5MB99_9CAUD|nr:hypothetical protein UFOVP435_45 [uncultured Caudovirales phage]
MAQPTTQFCGDLRIVAHPIRPVLHTAETQSPRVSETQLVEVFDGETLVHSNTVSFWRDSCGALVAMR